MLERLALAETRARIRADIARDGLNNWGRIPSWDCVQISISPHLPQHAGRTIAQLVAAARGRDPIDTLCDYLIEDRGATRVLVTSISEDDVRELVRSPPAPWSAPTATASRPTAPSARACRIRASTARFRASSATMSASSDCCRSRLAMHKMTGATARALKLADRGLLKEGYRADVAIFDPADFRDRATYADPHQYPSGARTTVIVNGTLVVEKPTHTGALPGKVLRRAADGRVG